MKPYDGHSAIVFGATKGIGRATAELLAERGAHVTVVGRSSELGQEVAAACRDLGPESHFVRADIARGDEVFAAVTSAVSAYGALTMAVNNAGLDIAKPMLDLSEEDFDAVFDVNTRGTWHCLKAEIDAMTAHGGSIVNVNSVGSRLAVPGNSLYGASKKAVTALTQYAAAEYGSLGIRVNQVSPGSTTTEMLQSWLDQAASAGLTLADFEMTSVLHRLAAPREQATVIAFLLSDEAAYVTGVDLPVDGGTLLLNRAAPTPTGAAPPTPGDALKAERS